MTIEKPPRKFESQNIVFYPSKGKLLWQNVLSLLFLFAGIGIIHLGYPPLSIWIGIPIVSLASLQLLIILPLFSTRYLLPFPCSLSTTRG